MGRNKIPENWLDIIVPVLDNDILYKNFFIQDAQDHANELRTLNNVGYDKNQKVHLITEETPLAIKKATEIIAYYFKREKEYDFAGYHPLEHNDPRDRIFLLTQDNDAAGVSSVIGAIVFRWRDYSNVPAQLVLAWVWLHPFLRRKGVLTTYWETFKKMYGNFHVESPLSHEMKAFLEKYEATK